MSHSAVVNNPVITSVDAVSAVKELSGSHERHANRPGFDDDIEQQNIDFLSKDLSQVLFL